MSKENDGGPFNPELVPDPSSYIGATKRVPGISVRTWLAGMAMQGLAASDVQDEATPSGIAACAVDMADALLKELEK